jgi:hypothetical protein
MENSLLEREEGIKGYLRVIQLVKNKFRQGEKTGYRLRQC